MKCLNEHEKKAYAQGYAFILGMDEAGRGPIAGPEVVAGVVFPKGYEHEEIYDSKKLSEKKREALFEVIVRDALWHQIEVVSVETIDALNIYGATKQAMEKIALDCKRCDYILTDAMPLDGIFKPYEAIVKGDQQSVAIAAASILAKVTRDHIMLEYDKLYPEYGFKNHKGYPTKKHLEALERFGILDIHRKSYGPVQKQLNKQISFDF